LVEAVAREYRAGPPPLYVTTNIDAQRTAIWDMGKIAASGDPGALDLFRSIMAASAAVQACFHPSSSMWKRMDGTLRKCMSMAA